MADAPAAGSDESAVDAFLQGGESLRHAPGPYFGSYGGRWMPESLIAALDELEDTFEKAKADPEFTAQIADLNKNYSGRPSLLTEAKRFAEHAGGVRIFLKREDLNHTGSHKINNVLGQALLAKRMGKTRVIAETGAGQHGVASATAAALLGLECVVYMGAEDCRRQALNVARMELLGATVIPVTNGSQTLKDAINEALRDWVANVDNTHYLLGTAAGAHPFPAMVRYFHEVIGEEARAQILEQTGRLPDAVVRLHRRRLQRHRHLPRLPRRPLGQDLRLRGRRRRRRNRTPRGHHHARQARRAARRPLLPHAGRRRPDHRIALHLGRPGLPRRRPGALLPRRHRTGQLRAHHGQRGHGRVPAAVPHRGHHPRHRVRPRPRRRHQGGPAPRRREAAGEAVGARS